MARFDATAIPAQGAWDRRRLLATLTAVAAAALAALLGLGYAVYVAVGTAAHPATGSSPASLDIPHPAGRDQIAAAAMYTAGPQDARGGEQATTPAEAITIPPATGAGPAQVPTGFPHTPQGAVGQLAAIETTVLQSMSIPAAHQVYDAWALPGGVGAQEWEMTANVVAFLGKNSPGQAKAVTTTVVATPAGAQIKGVDGPDWVLACVLLHVRATASADAAIGYGHCERMAWDASSARWMIGPGAPPARAPSTWPGTTVAIRAGWRTWTSGDQG